MSRVQRHSARQEGHGGEWRFCPWCGKALLLFGVCRFCRGPAKAYATACDACWLPRLAKNMLGDRTIEDVARWYARGLTWNEIGHKLQISRPRHRGKDTRFAATLLFDAAGHPGYIEDLVSRDSAERYAAALGRWLRAIAGREAP